MWINLELNETQCGSLFPYHEMFFSFPLFSQSKALQNESEEFKGALSRGSSNAGNNLRVYREL
jgi:hypothetical protein